MANEGSFRVDIDMRGMQRIIRETPGRVSDWLDGEAEEMVTHIKLSFGKSPPGRSYKRGERVHIASMPGYPPNIDTGALINTVEWEPNGPFKRIIKAGTDHAVPLEFGTVNMAARPFMGPEFEAERKRWAGSAREYGLIK